MIREERLLKVLKASHISEKSTMMAEAEYHRVQGCH